MRRVLPALFLVAAIGGPASALDVPYLSGRVNDEAHILDAATSASLSQDLKAFEAKTGHQVAVLTVASLDGESLETYSLKVARTWNLGRKGQNDGVLLLISRDDHKIRVETGRGLEGALPDTLSSRLVRAEIVPRFRAGDYNGGVLAGTRAILAALDGNYTPPPDAASRVIGKRNDFGQSSLIEKIMMSFFVFGILGVFEMIGITLPGMGWFLYFFLIPFWSAFPMAIWGAQVGFAILGIHLLAFPVLKLLLGDTAWGKGLTKNFAANNDHYHYGGSGWSSGDSFSGGSSSSSSSDSFSGGGGSFGGGGSSDSW